MNLSPELTAEDASLEQLFIRPSSIELLELTLDHFGSHTSRTVRFRPGMNLIYGPNASGKSTIAGAVFFALTGHALQPSARPTDAARSDHASLSLSFKALTPKEKAVEPTLYRIVRSTAGDLEFSIPEGPKAGILAATPSKSRLAIQKMLGLDSHRLSFAHFMREDEVGAFLSQTAGERKDVLRAALALDQWEKALKIFKEARRLARIKHKEIQSALKQIAEPLSGPESRIAELRDGLEKTRTAHRQLLDSEGGEHLLELGRARSRVKSLEQELESVLFPLPSSAHLVAELSKLEQALDTLSTLDTDVAFARQRLGEVMGLQQSVTSDLGRLRSLLDAGDHSCPTCEQILDLALIQTLIDQKQRTLDSLQSELSEARILLDKLELSEKERDEARRRFADLRVKREKVKTLTAELEQVLLWLEATKAKVSGEAARWLHELEARLAIDRAELEKLLVEQGAAAERRVQLGALQERATSSLKLKLRLEAAVEALEGTLSEVAEGWFAPMERRLGSLLQSMGILVGMGLDVHSNPMRPRVVEGEAGRDFVTLSGSERALLYLCFKAALSETLGVVPFLVLDEPTVHLDQERRRRLVRLLRQLAGTRKQLIVATNDPWLLESLSESHLISLAPA